MHGYRIGYPRDAQFVGKDIPWKTIVFAIAVVLSYLAI
jgi:hypothetical protein